MSKNTSLNYEIDNVDRDIINILMRNAKVPYSEIAKKLHISSGTVHVRMKKLEEAGIIKNSILQVNYETLGYDLSAFIGIHLSDGSTYDKVIQQLLKIPEVVEAYYTTGKYSIFAKIYCKNTKHLYQVLNHDIQAVNEIKGTETLICLEESIKRQMTI